MWKRIVHPSLVAKRCCDKVTWLLFMCCGIQVCLASDIPLVSVLVGFSVHVLKDPHCLLHETRAVAAIRHQRKERLPHFVQEE